MSAIDSVFPATDSMGGGKSLIAGLRQWRPYHRDCGGNLAISCKHGIQGKASGKEAPLPSPFPEKEQIIWHSQTKRNITTPEGMAVRFSGSTWESPCLNHPRKQVKTPARIVGRRICVTRMSVAASYIHYS